MAKRVRAKDRARGAATERERWERETLAPFARAAPEGAAGLASAATGGKERLYTSADAPVGGAPGFPGEPPFTRGIYPTMYRGRLWTMRQYAGFGTAAETNERFRYLLRHGQTGLSTAFDLPTQMGLDSDAPLARGEVGRAGVPIGSVEDMRALLAGIPLGKVSTSMTINATAAVLMSMYLTVARGQGVAWADVRGTVQNDLLKEYIARGTYIFPPGPSMRLTCDIIEFAAREAPNFNPISISGYHIREAGSTAVQEVAFTLADGIAYTEAVVERGVPVDAFAPQLAFFFNAHNDLIEEVAKFRAARTLWAEIMALRFAAKDPRSAVLRFHTQTAGSTLTAQQPENNLVRVALQALAAVLGGTQSLHTNAFDEALALPTEKAARIALRTQQVIAHESGVPNTVDPAAGAYAIEAKTREIADEARALIERVDAMGGMVRAIERGFPQREIHEAAYAHQRRVEAGDARVVGVNVHVDEAEGKGPRADTLKVREEAEAEQARAVAALRRRRDGRAWKAALAQLARDERAGANLMPSVLRAVGARATVGEICEVLRDAWGEYADRRRG
ncbi:MAG TPA: methylmalonyl-CoA mutase family protein [Candidatus Thermoplasmatota archaeon]